MCSKITKMAPFLQHILCRHVNIFCFVTGLCCHYSQLHFELQTQITHAPIQVLHQHLYCHIQYYIFRTVNVCKLTAALCTATSVLLVLGVLQCCDQHSVPGVPHHIPYRTGVRRTNQNSRENVKIRKKFGFTAGYDVLFPDNSDPVHSATLQYAVQCPVERKCFTWAAVYHNISTILNEFHMEINRGRKYLQMKTTN